MNEEDVDAVLDVGEGVSVRGLGGGVGVLIFLTLLLSS